MTKRVFLGVAALAVYLLGVWAFYIAAIWLCWYPLYGLIWGIGSAFLMGVAFCFSWARRSIKLSMLITTEEAQLLPQEESLVRASALPRSYQQAALLRAAQYGKETPSEELLRAMTDQNE
jgi:hypothetical protein